MVPQPPPSSKQMAESLRAHRAALALNNMAIHLLEKGHCGRALKTLHDSLLLLHIALVPPKEEEEESDKKNFDAAADRLRELSSKVFQAASQRYVASWKERDASDRLLCEIHVLEEEDFVGLNVAARYGPSASVIFLVRISESERDLTDNSRHLGILHYNFGVVSFVLSLQRHERKSGKLLQESYKSFIKATKVFTTLTETEKVDIVPDMEWALFSVIAFNALSMVYHAQDKRGKAEEAEKAGSILCTTMQKDSVFAFVSQQLHCAPAA